MVDAVATWRRTSDGQVHVLIEPASIARCGTSARELGEPLREVGLPVCEGCVHALLHDLNDTEAVLRDLSSDGTRGTDAARAHGRAAVGFLLQTVPDGPTRGLLTQAETLIGSDPVEAHNRLRQWRANMRAIGVFPRQDPTN